MLSDAAAVAGRIPSPGRPSCTCPLAAEAWPPEHGPVATQDAPREAPQSSASAIRHLPATSMKGPLLAPRPHRGVFRAEIPRLCLFRYPATVRSSLFVPPSAP